MANNNTKKTDWELYYSKKKNIFSTITQKSTFRKLVYYFKKYTDGNINILELGGGNSCFAEKLIAKFMGKIEEYSIVDNCTVAVEKFRNKEVNGDAYLVDLLVSSEVDSIGKKYDVVYSIGVVEHFEKKDLDKIIRSHFDLCKKNGLVLISIPTPTKQYKFVRKIMEIMHVWSFWDEKPMKYNEINRIVERYGSILEWEINYQLPLTQLIIVARNN